MMKTFVYLSIIILLLTVGVNTSKAQQMTIATKNACVNDTVRIPITSASITGLGALSLNISFDTTVLKYVGMENLASQLSAMYSGVPTQGLLAWKVVMSWIDNTLTGITLASGKVCDLKFIYRGGSSNITFYSGTELANVNGNALNVSYVNGGVSSIVLTAPANSGVCDGLQTSFTTTAIAGSSFVWQLKNGTQWNNLQNGTTYSGTTSSTLQVLQAPYSMNNSVYRCQVTNTCVDYSASSTLTVYSKPVIVISNDTAVCSGSPAIISGNGTTGYSPITYNWNNGLGSGISKTVTPTQTTSYQLTVTDGRNCVSIANVTVNINNLPAVAGLISGLASIHPGQNSLIYSVPSIANATSYIWTLPSGASGLSNTNIISVDYNMLATPGNITVKGHNDCGDGVASLLSITIILVKKLHVYAMIQGFYQAPAMNQTLDFDWNIQDMVPKFSNPLIVDTVSLLLRNTSPPYYNVNAEFHGLYLYTDGSITEISLPENISTNNYIILNHRNCLETWSDPVSFTETNTTYNFFTHPISASFEGNMFGIYNNGVYSGGLIWSGDINQDGVINIFDLSDAFDSINNPDAPIGYVQEDINGDGIVNIFDLSVIFDNLNSGAMSINPFNLK